MTTSKHGKMKAVRWEGKDESVSVKEIEIPRIQKPLDAIVRITSAAICGTDLHTYHGRIEMRTPLTFGHENIGVIEEVGSAVTTLQKGDRVVVSGGDFKDDADGDLGIEGLFGVGEYGGEYGTFRQMNGGQAQFMRVPNADVNFLVVPQGDNHELDYILLADVWPTAWFALDAAGQVFGDTVVVFGAGPVGLLCAYSARLRGAIRVYSVDHVPERLARAKSVGAIPINFTHGDPVEQILKLEPNGVDRSCDCCGFECINAEGDNVENLIITQAVEVTRSGGGIGLIGVYTSNDLSRAIDIVIKGFIDDTPGGSSKDAKKGILPVPIGDLWLKGINLKGGIIGAEAYKQTQLLLKNLIERDNAKPSFVFDREFGIDEAAEAFRNFSDHKLIKAVFRFDKYEKTNASSEKTYGGPSVRDPLDGEPVRKRSHQS